MLCSVKNVINCLKDYFSCNFEKAGRRFMGLLLVFFAIFICLGTMPELNDLFSICVIGSMIKSIVSFINFVEMLSIPIY